MPLDLRVIGPNELERYADVPMTVTVDRQLSVLALKDGLGGLSLQEQPVAPAYQKDYDAQGGPLTWPARFNLAGWRIVVALEGEHLLGGAAAFAPAVGFDSAVAELWDIRVRDTARRLGVGHALLEHQRRWARQQGYRWLKAETQNVNVAACRFYQHEGAVLGAINRFAYAGQSDIEHEVELDWFLPL
jgi:GNAT superfamily N-acetyltransferase